MRLALDRHLRLLHYLEERRLRLRRRAVDLVGEQQVDEHRAAARDERLGVGVVQGVPSCSMGFWVASTMKGGSSACAWPSIVTCASCITSRSAACVFAGARLISSASSRLTNTGPRRSSR